MFHLYFSQRITDVSINPPHPWVEVPQQVPEKVSHGLENSETKIRVLSASLSGGKPSSLKTSSFKPTSSFKTSSSKVYSSKPSASKLSIKGNLIDN